MFRILVETLYWWSARLMPCWFEWQADYVITAGQYLEYKKRGQLKGWPWNWRAE